MTIEQVAYLTAEIYLGVLQENINDVDEKGDIVIDEESKEPLYSRKEHITEYPYLYAFLAVNEIKRFLPNSSESIIRLFYNYLRESGYEETIQSLSEYADVWETASEKIGSDSGISNPIYMISKLAANRISKGEEVTLSNIIWFNSAAGAFTEFLDMHLKIIRIK